MARTVDWTAQIPEALVRLRSMNSQTVYRGTLEQIFQVPRRTAIRLMHEFGGEQAGRTFLLSRKKLIEQLEQRLAPTEFRPSYVRRQQREAAVFTFPDVRMPERRYAAQLPATIRLRLGSFCVDTDSLEDLCTQIWVFLETCRDDRAGIEALLRKT